MYGAFETSILDLERDEMRDPAHWDNADLDDDRPTASELSEDSRLERRERDQSFFLEDVPLDNDVSDFAPQFPAGYFPQRDFSYDDVPF